MPFDTIKAKGIITSLEAHQRHPGGELMLGAAAALKEAVADAGNGMALIRQAEAEAMKHQKAYEDTLLEIKTLRENRVLCDSALTVIREIASSKKGASQKAVDWLAANNLAPTTEPTAPAN